MSNYHLYGIITGVTIVLIIAVILQIMKKRDIIKKFDERQLVVRASCYKYAYWVLCIYIIIYAMLMVFKPYLFKLLGFVGLIIGILISVGVFVILAIVNNAFEALNDNKNRMLSILLIGVGNIIISISNFMSYGIMEDGSLSFAWINCACGILLTVASLVYKFKNSLDQDEEE